LEPCRELELAQVRRLTLVGLDGACALLELCRPRLESSPLRLDFLLGRLDCGGPPDQLVGRAGERRLVLLSARVCCCELLIPLRGRSFRVGELSLAVSESRRFLLDPELVCADGRFPVGRGLLPLAVQLVVVDRRRRPTRPKRTAAVACLRGELVELAASALDLELTPTDLGGALPERPLSW
jgi:hypothetical protein